MNNVWIAVAVMLLGVTVAGAAQMLLKNTRSLKISDRETDGTETERPVPMGLTVK